MTERTVSYLAVGVMLCGAVGLCATFSSSSDKAVERIVGAAAIVAFVLAICALRRRSWTRLPLVGACAFAGVLTSASFEADDDPMAIAGLAYALYDTLLILTAAVTLLILLVEHRGRTAVA